MFSLSHSQESCQAAFMFNRMSLAKIFSDQSVDTAQNPFLQSQTLGGERKRVCLILCCRHQKGGMGGISSVQNKRATVAFWQGLEHEKDGNGVVIIVGFLSEGLLDPHLL